MKFSLKTLKNVKNISLKTLKIEKNVLENLEK